jgi:hypothetical protein
VKRRALERYLRQQGCTVHRDGAEHTLWINAATGQKAPVPRHNEIKQGTARSLCRMLGIPAPPER